jgi:arylsulfatase B
VCRSSSPARRAGPQVQNGGRTVEDLVNTTDLFATVAEMAGLTAPTGDDSNSLMPYVEGAATIARTYAYAERFRGAGPAVPRSAGKAPMRDTQYKIIQSAGQLSECYDLASNPNETINLVGASTPSGCNDLHSTMRALQMGSNEFVPGT